ncbi:MAG: DUF5522 domain-containing protein [Myxococcota bacterium]
MIEAKAQRRHDAAVEAGQKTYLDPATGYHVFTATTLADRGRCCGSGCRHCPFGHIGVSNPESRRLAEGPSFRVRAQARPTGPVDVLFWSGGKDSYLTWLALREAGRTVLWLTTFDPRYDLVAHQEVSRQAIEAQARWLDVDLLMVPLRPDRPYADVVYEGLDTVNRVTPVARLAFGDLHLKEIRGFREQTLGPWAEPRGIELAFPLWQVPYDALKTRLWSSKAHITLSATPGGHGEVGQVYDARFVASLPDEIDAFGERGEFHTYVTPPSA